MSYRMVYRRLVIEIVEILTITIEPARCAEAGTETPTGAQGCAGPQEPVATEIEPGAGVDGFQVRCPATSDTRRTPRLGALAALFDSVIMIYAGCFLNLLVQVFFVHVPYERLIAKTNSSYPHP